MFFGEKISDKLRHLCDDWANYEQEQRKMPDHTPSSIWNILRRISELGGLKGLLQKSNRQAMEDTIFYLRALSRNLPNSETSKSYAIAADVLKTEMEKFV